VTRIVKCVDDVPCLEGDGKECGVIVLRKVYKRVILHFMSTIFHERSIESVHTNSNPTMEPLIRGSAIGDLLPELTSISDISHLRTQKQSPARRLTVEIRVHMQIFCQFE